MKLRRYCVTVMDNWTPTREFWTWRRALAHYAAHQPASHFWSWTSHGWVELVLRRRDGSAN
jgi:hypothetical protein